MARMIIAKSWAIRFVFSDRECWWSAEKVGRLQGSRHAVVCRPNWLSEAVTDRPVDRVWTYVRALRGRPVFRPFEKYPIHFIYINFYPNVSDYVTFGSWLSQIRLSVCLSVTLVRPTQGVEAFSNISSPLCTLAILWPPCKISRISSQGNPSIVSLNARVVAK